MEMEGNPEDSGVDSTGNQKKFVPNASKKGKLESVLVCESQSVESEVSPQEVSLSINHILEQILSSLDRTSLFKCRLVSRSWRLASTSLILSKKPLNNMAAYKRNKTYINFEQRPTDNVYVQQMDTLTSTPTLEDLTCFLKESYSLSGPFVLSQFPCHIFSFVGSSMSDPNLQSFLTTFGEYVSELYIHCRRFPQVETEASVIQQIDYLLNTQAPNLQLFEFYPTSKLLAITDATEDSVDDVALSSAGSNLPLPFQNTPEQDGSKKIQRKGQNGLRKLTFYYRKGTKGLFNYIISISPKLVEIDFVGCGKSRYHLLCSPINRLHFLKKFIFISDPDLDGKFNFENFKLIETALCISRKEQESLNLPPIKFRKLIMDFENVIAPMSLNPDIQSCFARVISKILELSWDTLETISLEGHAKDTLKGIIWPRLLPKVDQLILQSTKSKNMCSDLKIFPLNRKFKIQETFPKLKIIRFDEMVSYDRISTAGEFLRNCNFGPAPSVLSVEFAFYLRGVPPNVDVADDVKRLGSDFTNSLVRLFPSATLLITG